MTCKYCLHYEVCEAHEKYNGIKATLRGLFKSKADVKKVVRCKDCKHSETDYRCTYDGDKWRSPNHFCSNGERKEGAEE